MFKLEKSKGMKVTDKFLSHHPPLFRTYTSSKKEFKEEISNWMKKAKIGEKINIILQGKIREVVGTTKSKSLGR